MAPQAKKTVQQAKSQGNAKSSNPSSKMASSASGNAPKMAMSSIIGSRASAENVVKMGGEAVRDFLGAGAGEAQKAQEKAIAFGREGAENFARSADAASQGMSEMISLARDNIEAYMESANITANMAQELATELFQQANESFAQNIEISKEIFSCRTVNDVFELQTRLMRSTLDNLFSQSTKFSEMFFRYAAEAAEPINERVAETTDRLSRVFTA